MVGPAEGKRSDDADEFCAEENADACQGCGWFLKITTASSSLIRRISGCWYIVTDRRFFMSEICICGAARPVSAGSCV